MTTADEPGNTDTTGASQMEPEGDAVASEKVPCFCWISALGQGTPQFAFPVLWYFQNNIQFTFWEIKGSNGSNKNASGSDHVLSYMINF